MGGECLNTGCVPSKALLYVARIAALIRRAPEHVLAPAGAARSLGDPVPVSPEEFRRVMDHVRAAQARLAPHDSAGRFTAMGVRAIASAARLRSLHEVEVEATGATL